MVIATAGAYPGSTRRGNRRELLLLREEERRTSGPGISVKRRRYLLQSFHQGRFRHRNKTRVCFLLNPGTRRPRTCLRTT
jgi:hypothetical protein